MVEKEVVLIEVTIREVAEVEVVIEGDSTRIKTSNSKIKTNNSNLKSHKTSKSSTHSSHWFFLQQLI